MGKKANNKAERVAIPVPTDSRKKEEKRFLNERDCEDKRSPEKEHWQIRSMCIINIFISSGRSNKILETTAILDNHPAPT